MAPGYVLELPAPPSLAVDGTDARFEVRRIFCVGRNYAEHAREMGDDPEREPPFFFAKPADAAFDAGAGRGASVRYPPGTADLHHEVELAVALKAGGRDVRPERSLQLVFGYAVALDLTRRDVQAAAKKAGRPWALSKGFDGSAPCGPLSPVAGVGHPARGRIWLSVDGEGRQGGDLAEMIWSVPEVLSILSQSITLAPGDLILTGTPAGVGPLVPGNAVRAGIEGLVDLELGIDPA